MSTINKKRDENIRKNDVISENLDRIIDDMIDLFQETYGFSLSEKEKAFFRGRAKGILAYWLGLIYDEAMSEVKNLSTALGTSQTMVKKLRESQRDMQAIIDEKLPFIHKDEQKREEKSNTNNRRKIVTEPPQPLFPDVPDYDYRFSEENIRKKRKRYDKDPEK